MVGSLGPSVDAAASATKISLIFGTSLLLGSSASVLVLLLAGTLVRSAELAAYALPLLGVLCVPALLQPFGMRPLQRSWQVPERWRRLLETEVLTAFYGLLLGPGALTAVVVSGYWVFFGASIFMPPLVLVTGWMVFSLIRAVGFGIGSSRHLADALPGIAVSRTLLLSTAGLCALMLGCLVSWIY